MPDELDDLDLSAPAPKTNPGAQEVVNTFAGSKEDLGDLEYRELCHEMYKEFKLAKERLEAAKACYEMTRANILKVIEAMRPNDKRWAHTIQDLTLQVERKAGAVDFNWKMFVEDVAGPKTVKEAEDIVAGFKKGILESKYCKRGKGSTQIEVV